MTFTDADFEDDEQCLIDNPLRDLTPNELYRRSDEFARLVSTEAPDGRAARFFKRLARHLHLSNDGPKRPSESSEYSKDEPDEALIELFRKAAQVAQHPHKLHSLDLTNHERAVLKRERDVKFWDQPKALRVTVVTLCFSAIIQGWIQSVSNGANQNWPLNFDLIDEETGDWRSPSERWIFGGVNAITYLAASIFGCWLSDPLQSMILGRRGGVFVSGLLCFASLIGSACTRNWKQLMVCRALVGLGMGAKASVTPIFGAETSPSHLRGALVMNWQLFDAFGIFLGSTANIILLTTGPVLSWRLQFASACVPTVCLLTLIWTIPESPRWLLKQRRHRAAFKALCALRETHLQAAVELFYANAQLQIEAQLQPVKRTAEDKEQEEGTSGHVEKVNTYQELNRFQESFAMTNYFSRIWQLFREPRTRRATIAALVVMIAQQLCGMNVVIFYSSTFFRDAGGPSAPSDEATQQATKALWLSWGVGLANFLFTFPAYSLIDTRGRRFLLFCTYPGMILSMLAASLSFLHRPGLEVKVAIFMFIFVFFYSWGQGPVPFAYSSEVFPLINREAGMSFAVFVNLFGAGILTLLVPLAQTTRSSALTPDGIESSSNAAERAHAYDIGQARLLGIFVALNVIALILIFLFVPETAGATVSKEDGHHSYMKLEELNYIFGASTKQHVSYQVKYMIPYAYRMAVWWTLGWMIEVPKPAPPKKMWVWAEMRDLQSNVEEFRKNARSSGIDQLVDAEQEETGGNAKQRSGIKVMEK